MENRKCTSMAFFIVIFFGLGATGCSSEFLDAKPRTDIVVPNRLQDMRDLLDNTSWLNQTGALGQMACDDYEFVDYASWLAANTATERNSYIWAKDIFEGEMERLDWNRPYVSVFYANNVLDMLSQTDRNEDISTYDELRGWALFVRSFAFYDLVRNFCKVYDERTAETDLGIPLKLSPNVDESVNRASLEDSYGQILDDLKKAAELLPKDFQYVFRNRPSTVAAHALLARIYLSMNLYEEAEVYADSVLSVYDLLIDYNDVSLTSTTPFSLTNAETIISTAQVGTYDITINGTSNTAARVVDELLEMYDAADLRLKLFFAKNAQGNTYVKRGYYGTGIYPFSGLATDEIYLIKAECLVRRDEVESGINILNELLVKRYETGSFVPIVAASQEDALQQILTERRKELVWRGIRWSDLKRLNKEGREITLRRMLNGNEYVLHPNSPEYVFPIPSDEISRSGIEQNRR